MSHTSSIPVIGKRDDPRWALALAFSLFLMVFMPSSESLWVDEGYIAQIISHPRLLDMLSALHCHSGSEPQMPLAALFYWTWGKFFGHSELALRIANLLPLGLGIIALALACRPQRMVWPFLLVAASPMTWFYVNEIRPYALQLGGSAGAAASLLVAIVYGKLNTTWTIVLCVSCLIVAASSLLGLFCLFGVVAVLGFQLLRGRFYLRRNNWFVAIPAFLLFVLLCVYYSWTLLSGSGSARDRGVSLSGVGYFFYELLGFGGLGPGRLDIREISSRGVASMANLFSPFIPQLTLLAIVWLLICAILVVMAVCLMKARSQTVEAFVLILSPLPIGLGLLFLAALVMVFPVWGRHVVWILPFGYTALAVLFEVSEVQTLKRSRKIILIALCILLITSSIEQRFSHRHKKEDYRKAASIALAAARDGNIVWWVAASSAGQYYGLDYSGKKIFLHNPDVPLVNPDPDIICVSRPEFTDSTKVVSTKIHNTPFLLTQEFPGFQIFERRPR